MYREDYEEDVIQNQGLTTTGYNDNYNNQYQTPYYNYQEDYFNEEDEYKYLEEEREKAANLEHQKKQQIDQHRMLDQHRIPDQHRMPDVCESVLDFSFDSI